MSYTPIAQRKVTPTPAYKPISAPKISLNIAGSTPAVLPVAKPQPIALGPVQPVAPPAEIKPPFVADATISRGEPSTVQKVLAKLPDFLRTPVENIVSDIHEGLFGDDRTKATIEQYAKEGYHPDLATSLSTGGLVKAILPSLGQSDTDRIDANQKALEDKGIDPARAAQIAFYDTYSKKSGVPGSDDANKATQARAQLALLNPTKDEQSALFWSDLLHLGGKLLDVAGILPVGSLAKSASLVESLRILPHTPEGVAEATRVLTQAGVAEDIARQAAPKFAELTDAKEIENGLQAIENLQNTTKAAYKPVAQRVEEGAGGRVVPKADIPPTLQPLAAAARKYDTVEEFKAAITPQQYRVFLNEAHPEPTFSGKNTDTGRPLGQKTRAYGDYLYNQDREMFNANLSDVQKNINPHHHADLTDFYNKAKETSSRFEGETAQRVGKLIKRPEIPTTDEESLLAMVDKEAKAKGLPTLPKAPAGTVDTPAILAAAKKTAEEAKVERDIGREVADLHPGRELQKFEARSGEFKGRLPEVGTKAKTDRSGFVKNVTTSKYAKEGDRIAEDLGYTSQDEAQAALDDYKKTRERVKAAEQNVRDKVKDYRDRKAVFDEVVKYINGLNRDRRGQLNAVQDFFKLDDQTMKEITRGWRDIRLMGNSEFADFMKMVEGKATEAYLRNQALVELQSTILEKEFKKLENLQKALKLPTIENMTAAQLRQFDEFLQPFEQGDTFLGPRQLETIRHTDLNGIYTMREAKERLVAQVNKERRERGLAPVTLGEMQSIKKTEFDDYRYDTALARRNPLYDLMVHETQRSFLQADEKVFAARERINELFKAARESRNRGLLDRLIPTDQRIFEWLEATDAAKLELAKDMTHEELEAAMYIRDSYAEMRDYLIGIDVLKKYKQDYVTHVRRGFLEGWKEEAGKAAGMIAGEKPGVVKRTVKGFLGAAKEVFKKYVQDEAYFNILDQQTDQVLPLEKFFQFSMRRSGELAPSKNVAKAYLSYLSTFERKRALDAIVPKLDIYVHSLEPQKLTPRGLLFDSSLRRFFKEWMNTKKGRASSRFLVKPGGQVDWGLRTGVALTRLMDLGLALPVGLASNVGAQLTAYRALGEAGYAKGLGRLFTPHGREVLKKYEYFTGEPITKKAFSAEGTLGDNLMAGVFGLFSYADRKARQVYLLGSMTPAEYAKGEVDPSRLARLKVALGRHLPIDGSQSIVGKTAAGEVFKQYKTWAIPLLSSTLDDISKLGQALRGNNPGYLKSPEFRELLRTTLVSAAIGLGAYGVANDSRPQKEMTFVEKLLSKSAQDALSYISAVDPRLWTNPPRTAQFVADLGTAVAQIVLVEHNKNGDLAGVNKLKSTLTPGVVKQLVPPQTTSSAPKKGALPKLPKLPKATLPKLPKLPKI